LHSYRIVTSRAGGRIAEPAQQAGEMITLLGEYSSMAIGPLLDSHQTDVGSIMSEWLETDAKALELYRELLKCAEGRSVILEEYAREMVYVEELHASEVDKMPRKSGEEATGERETLFKQ
jgi:bacterioferritin